MAKLVRRMEENHQLTEVVVAKVEHDVRMRKAKQATDIAVPSTHFQGTRGMLTSDQVEI